MRGGSATDPSGLVSVMPQAWMIGTPNLSWNRSMSERGTAEPPQTIERNDVRSEPCSSAYLSTSFQMVGTAPANVGRSLSMILTSGSACRNCFGMMRSAPLSHAA